MKRKENKWLEREISLNYFNIITMGHEKKLINLCSFNNLQF